jgi:hypothetical protein
MDGDKKHTLIIEKKISALSDALAHLGKGTSLRDLILIIKQPGWTTPAELAFAVGMLDAMSVHAKALDTLGKQLVKAGKLVK